MKNALLLVSAAVFGIGFGLFLNDLAHRYSIWLYLVHYGESLEWSDFSVPRFFASPIYAALGFFAALYAVVPDRGTSRKRLASLGAYVLGTALGFGISLSVHPLFHRLGYRLSEDAARTIYTGLDVFVCPLIVFGMAALVLRLTKRSLT